jgi:hypothetical protein
MENGNEIIGNKMPIPIKLIKKINNFFFGFVRGRHGGIDLVCLDLGIKAGFIN